MTKKPLYQVIATNIQSMKSCEKSENIIWFEKWKQSLEAIEQDLLPLGSGIDCKVTIDLINSNDKKIILESSFHCMDEHGFYDGWQDFKAIIESSLTFGITLKITGRFGQYSYVKDYLHDVFYESLNQEVDNDIYL